MPSRHTSTIVFVFCVSLWFFLFLFQPCLRQVTGRPRLSDPVDAETETNIISYEACAGREMPPTRALPFVSYTLAVRFCVGADISTCTVVPYVAPVAHCRVKIERGREREKQPPEGAMFHTSRVDDVVVAEFPAQYGEAFCTLKCVLESFRVFGRRPGPMTGRRCVWWPHPQRPTARLGG